MQDGARLNPQTPQIFRVSLAMKAQELRSLYDHGYFHGVNSGYPLEGYALCHPVWTHWIDYVLRTRPQASRWLDIGCAYGYLVQESRLKGFDAYGIDISSFALGQSAGSRQYLLETLAECAPFRDSTFDVVSIFDVIEHLHSPELAIAEISRLLKPGGLCIGSTPDPLFFHRFEETHFSENPPSFWHSLFRRYGLEMVLRFAGEPFNMEFVAVRAFGTETVFPQGDPAFLAFQHDRFHPDPDILNLSPSLKGQLLYAYRQGWGLLQGENKDHRLSFAPESSIYLLNTGAEPLSLEIELTVPLSGKFGSFRAQLDDRPIGAIHLENVDQIRTYHLENTLISSGGHHLRIFLENNLKEMPVQSIIISGRTVSHEHLVESLPFDLYQRYELVHRVLDRVYPKSLQGSPPDTHVVDIGGVMGGADGHMGSLADFLPGWPVQISDVRSCDIPIYVKSTPDNLPFAARSCDVLLCLDVFEHIPPAKRSEFLLRLMEIPRQLLVIACPCFREDVLAAEEVLDEFIRCKVGYRHQFIAEHLEYGLPTQHEIEDAIRSRGLDFVSFPNGNIHRWLFMQLITFYLSTMQSARLQERVNRFYNREFFILDNSEPSYRRAFIIDTQGSGVLRNVDFSGIFSAPGAVPNVEHWSERAVLLLQLLNADELGKGKEEIKRLGFLLSEREKYISDLLRHIRNLEQIDASRGDHIKNLEFEIADLRRHARNLDQERDELRRHALNLDTHRDSLQSNLLDFQSVLVEKDNVAHQLQLGVTVLENERMNLLRRINEVELDRLEIQKKAMELETLNLESGKRLNALENQLSDSQNHEIQLQSRMQAMEAEYSRLSGLLSGRDLRDIVPLLKEFFKRSVR